VAFALFRRPGSVVFVDDDAVFLEMLQLVLPRRWHALFYTAPRPVISLVQQSTARYEADASALQSMVFSAHDMPLVPQLLTYLNSSPERFDMIQTVVSDYSMPAMDGLDLFRKIGDWGGSRILLTGQANDQVAIDALNAHPVRLIEQFTAKAPVSETLSAVLTRMISDLSAKAHPRYAQVLRGLISDSHFELLQDRDVAEDLASYARRNWVEYFVIGQPFGVLGVTADGLPQWLQLEPIKSLPEAADIAGDAGCTPSEIESIAAGKALPAVELLGAGHTRVRPATALNNGKVLGALFEPWPRLAAGGYSQWLAARREDHGDLS
jgi:CheY-like chemotaxis protein